MKQRIYTSTGDNVTMTLSLDDSIKKYSDRLSEIEHLRSALDKNNFNVIETDKFELGSKWLILKAEKEIASLEWNVPYMLSFTPIAEQQEEEFELDYVKSYRDWKDFLNDIKISVLNAKV